MNALVQNYAEIQRTLVQNALPTIATNSIPLRYSHYKTLHNPWVACSLASRHFSNQTLRPLRMAFISADKFPEWSRGISQPSMK